MKNDPEITLNPRCHITTELNRVRESRCFLMAPTSLGTNMSVNVRKFDSCKENRPKDGNHGKESIREGRECKGNILISG